MVRYTRRISDVLKDKSSGGEDDLKIVIRLKIL